MNFASNLSLITTGVNYGMAMLRLKLKTGSFGDGRTCACPLAMTGLLLYGCMPWEKNALDALLRQLEWSKDEMMAFVAGYDGTLDPRRAVYPDHAALGILIHDHFFGAPDGV